MKAPKSFTLREVKTVTMRELEAGDRPRDSQGRELPFAPGDMYVEFPGYSYVLSRGLADALYVEED